MSDPYRDSGHRDQTEAPRDRGIVGDVIAQFADPNAFYRELVQNSIDADTPEVTVELRYDEAAQRMHASVRDRGSGMTREIIENQLLVLFRSTKEKDTTKIGKFGIGFKSVLATDPDVVVVNTARDGKRLLVHLYRDLSYELFDGGRATQSGTTVEVQVPMGRDQVQKFRQASEQALRHWCRHATVPIHFVIKDADAPSSVRIDTPLAIDDAVVQVTRTFDNGELTVIAGIKKVPAPYLGFFNHGLTLVENGDDKLGHVAVKVQDSRLGHTLSREDVRRDEHYDRAIEAVREVVGKDLPAAASRRMRELADGEPGAAYGQFLIAVIQAKLPISAWYFPLLEPRDDAKSIHLTKEHGRVYDYAVSTPLTTAVAKAGAIVLLNLGHAEAFATAVERACGKPLGDLEYELTSIEPIERTENDEALLAEVLRLLDAAHRKPAGIEIAQLHGAREARLTVTVRDTRQRLVGRDEAIQSPFAFLGRRAIALSVAHPIVKAAREHDDPLLAASHVARGILLEHELLDEARSRLLLDRALARVGVVR